MVPKSTEELARTFVVQTIGDVEVVGEGACTFVMSTADGEGLLVVLVPPTTPAQPVIAPSGTSDANIRNTLPKRARQGDAGLLRRP